jgi:Glycosyl transferases group 1
MRVFEPSSFEPTAETHTRSVQPPRICMPTWRNLTRRVFRCGLYEAQDVLCEIDDVDLICLDRNLDRTWEVLSKKAWLRTPFHDDVSRVLKRSNLETKPIELTKEYDLFIAVFNLFRDIPYVNAVKHWKHRCKVSACWIDEIWAADIPKFKHWIHTLSQFDYVFVGLKGSVPALSRALNRPCYWLPGGVDAFRFSPFPNPPARVVDVYSVGRRHAGMHRELLGAMHRGQLFYIHDTVENFAYAEVQDHRQHRNLFANIAKRSQYFTVAVPKMDDPGGTGGQIEVGYRYFEGAASGAVMIGDIPDSDAYRELFGWSDAVFQTHPDGSDIMPILKDLGSDPKRMAAIGRRNVREALLRHDWVYRWNEMFRVIGIKSSPGMGAREEDLKKMAALSSENSL